MEAKLSFHLRRAEIDMAFMVILELNIEDAVNHEVEKAVQVCLSLCLCLCLSLSLSLSLSPPKSEVEDLVVFFSILVYCWCLVSCKVVH